MSDRSSTETTPVRIGFKRNFSWALVGNLVYQASQWLVLIVLAKCLDVASVGRFSLALAISTPITALSTLNLRAVQITDSQNLHRFGHFLALQLLSSSLSVLIIVTVAVFAGYDASTAWLIGIVGVSQAVVVVRDVFIAFNQKHERMDAVASSQVILGLSSVVALFLLVWTTGSLLFGVLGFAAAKLLTFLLWDLRATARLARAYSDDNLRPIFERRALLELILLALPLGIASVLLSFYNNVPRYLIAAFLDEERLGYFAAILALAMAGTMVTGAAGLSASPRLSRYYLENRRAFMRLLVKLMVLGGVLGMVGLIVVILAGEQILRVLFTPEYSDHYHLFVWSMGFAAIAYVVSFLGFALTAMRRFGVQLVPQLVGVIVALGSGIALVPEYGLYGAVACLIFGKLGQGVVLLGLVMHGLKNPSLASRGAA